MLDAGTLTDWISASANVLAAVGTVGAFATGFALIKRERDLGRSAQAAGVQAFWQRTGNSAPAADVERNLRTIFDPAYSRRADIPEIGVEGPDRDPRDTRWYTYELNVRNLSTTQINTVEVWIEAHDGLGHTAARWQANTCPIAARVDVAPMLRDDKSQYFGLSLRRSIAPGATDLIAIVAYPSRIAFPEPVELTFIDGNGIQWFRSPEGDIRRMLSSRRKSAWRRQLLRRPTRDYYWKQTLGERT